MRVCELDPCDLEVHARDMCKLHYTRWMTGDRGNYLIRPKKRGVGVRKLNDETAPEERPSTKDIIWFAGFYEGDGYCSASGLEIAQKDPWTLKKIKRLFGGSIDHRTSNDSRWSDEGYYRWRISGARSRGLAMTIYSLLSPRRQEQLRREFFDWIEE